MRPLSTAQYQPVISQNVRDFADNLMSQFMWSKVLPVWESPDKTAVVPKWGVSELTKSTGNLKRNPKSGYERIEHVPGTFTFEAEEYGLEEPIDDFDKAYLDNFIMTASDSAQLTTHKLMIQQEKRVADLTFNTGTFTGNSTGAVALEWSDPTAKILDDVQDTILTLKNNMGGVIGMASLELSVSEKVFRNIMKNEQIQAQRGGKNGSNQTVSPISAAEIASILGVNMVNYSAAQFEANDIWDDEYALLHLSFDGQQLRSTPHIGRSINWTAIPGMFAVDTYREEKVSSSVLRVRQQFDEVVFTTEAGFLFQNITA